MTVIDQLKTLSRTEALIAMEALWDQLRQSGEELPLPDWHKEELDHRDRLIDTGDARFSDWDTAKDRIRERIRERIL